MASLEPPHVVTPHAIIYRVQTSWGLAPVWALVAAVVALCAVGNSFDVPLATTLFTMSAVLFGVAAVLGTISPEVEVGLHRLRVRVRVAGMARRAIDLPWESIAAARVVRSRLVLDLRSGSHVRTPVSGDPGQIAWVAGQITHRASQAQLTEDHARSLVQARANLEALRGLRPSLTAQTTSIPSS